MQEDEQYAAYRELLEKAERETGVRTVFPTTDNRGPVIKNQLPSASSVTPPVQQSSS